jgi:hypothetical protein
MVSAHARFVPAKLTYKNGDLGQRYPRGIIQLDFVKERFMRNRGNRGNHGRVGRNDWDQRAAEFHDLGAHAHRVAATHHGQEDHQTGHEVSKQAMKTQPRLTSTHKKLIRNQEAPSRKQIR